MNDKTKMDAEREAFESSWVRIQAVLPSHHRYGYSATDVEYAERAAAFAGWQARASLPVDGVVVPIEFLKLINALGWVGPSGQIEKACEQLDALLARHEQQEGE